MNTYELVPVTINDIDGQKVLINLTKMYCCEWSQYTGMDVNDLGCYGFEQHLPGYWQKPDCKAFLLRCIPDTAEPKWAGFVLMDRDFIIHRDFDYAMAEFFVLPKYRKHGAGTWMARALFDSHRGRWELGRNPKNAVAYAFWEKLIAQYTHDSYELTCHSSAHRYPDGTLGDVFAFDSRRKYDDDGL